MLGNSIRARREARGETLQSVASAVGMDRAHLHRVERNRGSCSEEKMLALASYFEVPVTDLFFQPLVDTQPTNKVPA